MTTKLLPPCKLCPSCVDNCRRCPHLPCNIQHAKMDNRARINKQVFMSASQALQLKKVATVSKIVGQSACPRHLSQAGGPGDLQSAIQQTAANPYKKACKRNCYYRMPILNTRTAYVGKSGVDRKHGSYARYLARRVGGELRKEKMPNVVARTAIIKQPRNRTGTNSCGSLCRISPADSLYKSFVRTTNKTLPPNCYSNKCCANRMPNCEQESNFTGKYGNNTQGVGSSRCNCCPTYRIK